MVESIKSLSIGKTFEKATYFLSKISSFSGILLEAKNSILVIIDISGLILNN